MNKDPEKEEKQRVRREYAKRGERSQKMVSFRLDNENANWLEMQGNKGRYINQLISNDMEKHKQHTNQLTMLRK